MRKTASSILAASVALVLSACSGGGSSSNEVPLGYNVSKATCGASDKPETGLQGQVPAAMRASGFDGFNCNLQLASQSKNDGASWQTARFQNCLYYDTSINTANRTHLGVAVIDYSNSSKIAPTAFLTSKSMLDPWESLKVNERRQLLGATFAQNGSGGPELDLYDLSADCRQPQLLSSTVIGTGADGDLALPAGQLLRGHEGEFAPDGLTYYAGDRGVPLKYTAIDISNKLRPKLLSTFAMPAGTTTHGLSFSPDGNRAFVSQAGVLGSTSLDNLGTRAPINGVLILDVSDIQARKANPQMREVSRFLWNDGGQMQHTIYMKVGGKPYVVAVDEAGVGGNSTAGWTAACNQGITPYPMARIIDVSTETAPKLASRVALEIHDPANCSKTLPDLVGLTSFTYGSHYCSVDDKEDATILACGYFNSGIRVFDIRNPAAPREIAYFNPAGPKTVSPGSNHTANRGFVLGGPDWCSAQIYLDKAKGELWTSCHDNGALALKFTNGVWPFR
jgi:hypothetical protein